MNCKDALHFWVVKYILKISLMSFKLIHHCADYWFNQTGNGREKCCSRTQNCPQTLRQQWTPCNCNEGCFRCLVVSCLKLAPVILLLHGISGNALYSHSLMIQWAVYSTLFQCRMCNMSIILPVYCRLHILKYVWHVSHLSMLFRKLSGGNAPTTRGL